MKLVQRMIFSNWKSSWKNSKRQLLFNFARILYFFKIEFDFIKEKLFCECIIDYNEMIKLPKFNRQLLIIFYFSFRNSFVWILANFVELK